VGEDRTLGGFSRMAGRVSLNATGHTAKEARPMIPTQTLKPKSVAREAPDDVAAKSHSAGRRRKEMFSSMKSGRRIVPLVVATATVALGLVAAPQAWAHTTRTAIDLGTLSGSGGTSRATAINDRGEIVGSTSTPSGATHAFLWRHGKMIDLGTLGGRDSSANDINARGEIVGYSDTRVGLVHAFRWRSGRMIDLGGLNEMASTAAAINNRGDVVGESGYADFRHAVRWSHGKIIDLGPVNAQRSSAFDINNHGQIVGETDVDEMNTQPILWRGTSVRPLDKYGTATAINDRGQVAGHDYGSISFLWEHGKITHFRVPTSMFTQAFSINERGQIVGGSDYFGFVWQRGKLTLLPHLPNGGWTSANDINNHGQVVGSGAPTRIGLGEHAVLWTTS
jgi:probable HAF family extracellular repeat protein